MLLRWATSALEEEDVLKDQPRVAPSEFRLAIADAVRALQAAGTMVVLVAEPTLGTDDYPYREAMVETAVETQSLFLSSERIVGQAPDVTRAFSRGSLLSSSGYDALAEGVVSRLRTVSSEL
jgi:Asp-tRNA(Asn)/Glu-tRNA(Gln) amidotransferase A subunit family amidase